MGDEKKSVKGYISVTDLEKQAYLASPEYFELQKRANLSLFNQAFKGEVLDKSVKFPKGLGAAHPFDFNKVQQVLENIGIVNAIVDKITDKIIGDFTIKIDDKNSQVLIDSFIDESNFLSVIRPWIKEGVGKGNGFMELDLKDLKNIQKLRVMNANGMFVRRTKKGKVLGYNQFIGNLNRMNITQTNVVPFTPNQIVHLKINKSPNEAYGRGLVWPNMRTIEHYAGSELDLHKLLSRKAGAPIHVKLGQPGETINPKDIDDFKADLQYMNNSTEWVTDGNTEMNPIDFKDIGKNLTDAANHDMEQLAIGMQIPMVSMGIANIAEGLAEEQGRELKQFIQSKRVLIEDIIETQILRPLLRTNKRDGKITFIWDLPGEKEKDERLKVINESLKNPFISDVMRAGLELEYATIMGLDDLTGILIKPKDAKKEQEEREREEEETEIEQPEVPGVKPAANELAKTPGIQAKCKEKHKHSLCECNPLTEAEVGNMSVAQYVNITEIAGFNYSDYLVKILLNLRTEKFEDLLALTEEDLISGLLPKKDINKLRVILKDGFRKNKTIREIEKDISQGIDLKDRTKIKDGKKITTLAASRRPNAIARTETVKLANQGLKDLYIENEIKSYRYLAPLSERTCPICEDLNGQVFLVKEGTPGLNMPAMHVDCRCTIVGLVD